MARRFRKILNNKTKSGTIYKKNVIYPEIPLDQNDVYVISQYGDRYDTLAQEFYKDSELWWIISSANNYQKGSLNVTPGVQLRIPADKSAAVSLFEEVNKTR
jgi:hypothetical protein|tara:strand:- start:8001 stop:8306 length:306 start_codon:yes stop_codon:yes gene_type:complete